MKNKLNYTARTLADIPALTYSRYNAIREGVRAFYESDDDVWEVDNSGYKDARALVNGLYTATKKERLEHSVRVMQRRGRVFLVRVAALRK